MSAGVEYKVCYQGYRRRVWISATVARIWEENRQVAKLDSESFGVLVGETSVDKRELWIDAATSPMAKDRRSRLAFHLRDPGHQRFVYDAFEQSNGSQIYLGTWHSHSERVPNPSCTDLEDWGRCLQRNRKRPLAFVIVGSEQTRVFVRWGCFFKALRSRTFLY